MKNRIILDFKNNILRNTIKVLLLTSFFTVVFSSLLVNHIGEVFEGYITENLDLYVSVLGNINDESMWSQANYVPEENYARTWEYFDYVSSIDSSLYEYNECTFTAGSLINEGYEGNRLKCWYFYTQSSWPGFNEASQFMDRQRIVEEFPNVASIALKQLSASVVNETEFHDLKEGDVGIIEGRTFTEEEIANGENVCLVNSRTLYVGEENGEMVMHFLHPGDKISCTIICEKDGELVRESFELTVIGVYRPTVDFIHFRSYYVPLGFYQKVMNKMAEYDYQGINFNVTPGVAYFGTKGLDQLKELISVIKTNDHGYGYYTNTNEIADALSSCVAIKDNIKGISSISFVTCLLFCITLIVLDVYYRKKEMGLLMSFGEERKALVRQIIIEEVILYVIASVLAFLLSRLLSGVIVDYLLNNSAGHDILVYGGHQVKTAPMNVDLSLSGLDFVIFGAYIVLLIVMNEMIISAQVRMYSPKELLAGE